MRGSPNISPTGRRAQSCWRRPVPMEKRGVRTRLRLGWSATHRCVVFCSSARRRWRCDGFGTRSRALLQRDLRCGSNYLFLGLSFARALRASSMARCSGLPYSMQLRRRSSIAFRASLVRAGTWAMSISKTAESEGVCHRYVAGLFIRPFFALGSANGDSTVRLCTAKRYRIRRFVRRTPNCLLGIQERKPAR
jgi:hypothetical protein